MQTNQSKKFTPYSEVNDILSYLSTNLQKLLQDQLVGIYLIGSLTYGDFELGSSDIDLIVILHSALTFTQKEQVQNIHMNSVEKHLTWANRIECSYITKDMLSCEEPPSIARPYLNKGRMWEPDPCYGNEWLINLFMLYEYGIALVGAEPKTLLDVKPRLAAVKAASRKDFDQEWKPLLADHSRLQDSHFQAYAVLTLCRILYRAMNDDVISKRAAASWIKKNYSHYWDNLIATAESWQHGQEMNVVEKIVEFIQFVQRELDNQPMLD